MNSDKSKSNMKINIVPILLMVIFITNISQIPALYGGIMGGVVNFSWLLLFGSILIKTDSHITVIILPIMTVIALFDVYLMILFILKDHAYLTSSFVYPIHISIFILMLGFLLGQFLKKDIVKDIGFIYVMSTVILAVIIYFNNFRSFSWDSIGYAFGGKNSVAPIILTAITFIFIYGFSQKKYFNISIVLFLVMMLLMLKSRAALMSLILLIFYLIFFNIKKRRNKILSIIGCVVFLIVLFKNDSLNSFLINDIFLNNLQNESIDDISSGRINHLEYFKQYFSEYMFVGNGSQYLESMPLATLFSYGIIGAIPLFIFALYPLYVCFKYNKVEGYTNLKKMIVITSLTMLINSLFEQLSPFGPGVKCYMLWLLTGLFLGFVSKEKDEIRRIN